MEEQTNSATQGNNEGIHSQQLDTETSNIDPTTDTTVGCEQSDTSLNQDEKVKQKVSIEIEEDGEEEEDEERDFSLEMLKVRSVEESPSGRYVRLNQKLGEGAFKKVYRAYDTQTGIEVAWNLVKIGGIPIQTRNRIINEMKILDKVHNDHIIAFYDSWIIKEKECVVFITEMVTSGTLKQFVTTRPVRLHIIKKWCKQILSALKYLHNYDPPIMHRDLKLDNIFINGGSGEIRIGDLGLASWEQNNQGATQSVLGTPEYMAPELYEENYDETVDIYSFGMCVLEMFTTETPYLECVSAPQIYKKVINGIPPEAYHRLKDSPAKQFIWKCIKTPEEGTKRPSATDLLDDPFLVPNPDDLSINTSSLYDPLPESAKTDRRMHSTAKKSINKQENMNVIKGELPKVDKKPKAEQDKPKIEPEVPKEVSFATTPQPTFEIGALVQVKLQDGVKNGIIHEKKEDNMYVVRYDGVDRQDLISGENLRMGNKPKVAEQKQESQTVQPVTKTDPTGSNQEQVQVQDNKQSSPKSEPTTTEGLPQPGNDTKVGTNKTEANTATTDGAASADKGFTPWRIKATPIENENKVTLKMSRKNRSDGKKTSIEFVFDMETETATHVATELVRELNLPQSDLDDITMKIVQIKNEYSDKRVNADDAESSASSSEKGSTTAVDPKPTATVVSNTTGAAPVEQMDKSPIPPKATTAPPVAQKDKPTVALKKDQVTRSTENPHKPATASVRKTSTSSNPEKSTSGVVDVPHGKKASTTKVKPMPTTDSSSFCKPNLVRARSNPTLISERVAVSEQNNLKSKDDTIPSTIAATAASMSGKTANYIQEAMSNTSTVDLLNKQILKDEFVVKTQEDLKKQIQFESEKLSRATILHEGKSNHLKAERDALINKKIAQKTTYGAGRETSLSAAEAAKDFAAKDELKQKVKKGKQSDVTHLEQKLASNIMEKNSIRDVDKAPSQTQIPLKQQQQQMLNQQRMQQQQQNTTPPLQPIKQSSTGSLQTNIHLDNNTTTGFRGLSNSSISLGHSQTNVIGTATKESATIQTPAGGATMHTMQQKGQSGVQKEVPIARQTSNEDNSASRNTMQNQTSGMGSTSGSNVIGHAGNPTLNINTPTLSQSGVSSNPTIQGHQNRQHSAGNGSQMQVNQGSNINAQSGNAQMQGHQPIPQHSAGNGSQMQVNQGSNISTQSGTNHMQGQQQNVLPTGTNRNQMAIGGSSTQGLNQQQGQRSVSNLSAPQQQTAQGNGSNFNMQSSMHHSHSGHLNSSTNMNQQAQQQMMQQQMMQQQMMMQQNAQSSVQQTQQMQQQMMQQQQQQQRLIQQNNAHQIPQPVQNNNQSQMRVQQQQNPIMMQNSGQSNVQTVVQNRTSGTQ